MAFVVVAVFAVEAVTGAVVTVVVVTVAVGIVVADIVVAEEADGMTMKV